MLASSFFDNRPRIDALQHAVVTGELDHFGFARGHGIDLVLQLRCAGAQFDLCRLRRDDALLELTQLGLGVLQTLVLQLFLERHARRRVV